MAYPTKTDTTTHGIMSVSGTFRAVLTGQGQSQGPILDWVNSARFTADMASGWAYGEGTVTAASDYADNRIHLMRSDGIMSYPIGEGSFQPGFSPAGHPIIGLYVEITANNTETEAITHPVELAGRMAGNLWLFQLGRVGDFYAMVNRASFGVLSHTEAADTDIIQLELASTSIPDAASISFRVIVVYGQ